MAPGTLADILRGGDGTPALFAAGRTAPYTRAQVRQAVYELAKTLHRAGIRQGDVVSIAEANTVRFARGKLELTQALVV